MEIFLAFLYSTDCHFHCCCFFILDKVGFGKTDRERLEKFGLTILLERRMKGDLIETFKIKKFLFFADIFSFFLLELEIYNYGRFQELSLLTTGFFAIRVIYVLNKLPNPKKKKKKSASIKKI